MTETDLLEQRIQELEMHLANQDGTVQDLSDAVAGQWDIIDKLSRTVENLKDRLLNMEDAVQRSPDDDTPPPHY